MDHAAEFEASLNELEMEHYLIQLKYGCIHTKTGLLNDYSEKESITKLRFTLPTSDLNTRIRKRRFNK